MPDQPQSFDELVDALKDHPEWRHNLRDLLTGDGDPDGPPPPPPRSRWATWLPTLGIGVLIGAIVAGVAAFALLNDDDDETSAASDASPSASASASAPGGAASPTGTASPARTAPAAATSGSATAATASPEPTATPTLAPQPTPTNAPQPQPTQPQPAPTSPPNPTAPPSGSPVYTFSGFEGSCAPVSAVVTVTNVTRTITMAGSWTGPTFITVGPLTIQPPGDAGAIVTVRFPTVAPLTPGTYMFVANADGAVVASASTNITC